MSKRGPLTITVSGRAKTGTTSMSLVLKDVLTQIGFTNIKVIDDEDDENSRSNFDKKLLAMRDTEIRINQGKIVRNSF